MYSSNSQIYTVKLVLTLIFFIGFVYVFKDALFNFESSSVETEHSSSNTLFSFLSPIQTTETPILRPYIELLKSTDDTGTTPVILSPNMSTVELAQKVAYDYNIPEETFMCVIQYESGFNSRRADGSLKCGDGGQSCGLGQIQYPTWVSIRSHAGMSTEDLRGDDYENLVTTAYGMTHGWKFHWTGYHLCANQGKTI